MAATPRETLADCGRGCTELIADAACPDHGVVAYLAALLDEPAVAYDAEDPHRPGGE